MSYTFDPNAIAEDGSGEYADVTERDIYAYVIETWGWPPVAVSPFARYADEVWYEYNDGSGTQTNGQILDGIRSYWQGDAG